MSYLEKLGYAKGLAKGLSFDDTTNEGKLLLAILDLLDEMADAMEDAEEQLEELDDLTEELSDRMDDSETVLSEFLDLFGEIDDDDDCDCDDCAHDGDEDEILYDIKCPQCEAEIVLDLEMLNKGSVVCQCGQTLEFDWDDADEQE